MNEKEEKEEKEDFVLEGELDELEAGFKELDAEFGLDLAGEGFEPEAIEAMSELEDEMDLAGISEFGEELGEEMSFTSLGMDEVEVQGFFKRWIERKARRLIQKLIAIVQKHGRKCAPCARMLAETIRLFRRKKYVSAIWKAYRTYRCIRRCIRR